jgi:hypothetical protein
MSKLDEILKERRFPGVRCGTGPGSSENEMVWDRPDVAKETRLTLKKMEENGALKTDKDWRAAKILLEANSKIKPTRDFQKEGKGPLDK